MRKINFDKPLWIAAHFGFAPVEAPAVTEEDLAKTADCEESIPLGKERTRLVCNAPEKAAFLRAYIVNRAIDTTHPVAISWKRGRDYSLELVGYQPGLAEAKLIRASLSILSEEGYKGLSVEINSIGDKDSIASYERELHAFVRKLGASISAELKKLFKDDPFAIAKVESEEASNLRKEMPQSVSHLSAQSRNYFKEVIEHLEALGVEYRFAPELVGHRNLCSETLFAIRDNENALLAAGYGYSRLSRRFGFKKELPLMGATIYGLKKLRDDSRREAPRPKFYLVHLGREARMRALPVLESLRLAHISVCHFLGREKLSAQMEAPEALRAPYHIIIGQKEALDSTVTVRNVASRAQDTIPLSLLPNYLKHLPF